MPKEIEETWWTDPATGQAMYAATYRGEVIIRGPIPHPKVPFVRLPEKPAGEKT